MAEHFLAFSCLLMVLLGCSHAQQCDSPSVEAYVMKQEEATMTAINAVENIVALLGNSSAPQQQSNETAKESLYNSITATFNLEKSNASFMSFTNALDEIARAHFLACFGSTESQPNVADAPALINQLLSDLNVNSSQFSNRTLLSAIRSTFGELTCLREKSTVSRRQAIKPDECSPTLASFQNCMSEEQMQCLMGVCEEVVNGQQQVTNQWHRCVGFVVDDTGSMSEEIAAVRTNILQFIEVQQNSGLLPDCYVLVTFNDYGNSDPVNNVGPIKVYDPTISDAATQPPTISRNNGQAVGGTDQLRSDIMAIRANGGGDCPEYGMSGIQQAMNGIASVEFPPDANSLHHIIVLTDASAKDDNLYQNVIAAAVPLEVTIHFFFSGTAGCGSGYGNYMTVRDATRGISVTNFGDFELFGSYIQQFNDQARQLQENQLNNQGRRKRQSTTSAIFSEYATCHNVSVSIFSRSIAVLVRTTQSSVMVTKPNGTIASISITSGGVLGLFEEASPQSGLWTFCASPGTLQISVNAPIELELDVAFTRSTTSGEILPTSEIPFACTTGTVIVTTPQLSLIEVNRSIYLDFVRRDGTTAATIELDECNGILSGKGEFSGSLILYRLRGTDIQGNSFANVIPNSQRRFQAPSVILQVQQFDTIPVNPGETSYFKILLLHNTSAEVAVRPSLQLSVPDNMTIQLEYTTDSLPVTRQVVLIELTAANDSLTVGQRFSLNASVSENCTDVVTESVLDVLVYQPVPMTVTNITRQNKLLVQWNLPNGIDSVHQYRLLFDYDNGTVAHFLVDSDVLQYSTNTLAPHQPVFISLAALTNTSDILGFTAPKMFISDNYSCRTCEDALLLVACRSLSLLPHQALPQGCDVHTL